MVLRLTWNLSLTPRGSSLVATTGIGHLVQNRREDDVERSRGRNGVIGGDRTLTCLYPNVSTGRDAVGSESHLSHVPALDGIRAVAVLVVMSYHGGVLFASGGFYGVDTFFTLSGFLITSLLLTEWKQSGAIRLTAFWVRRARRLLPALLLMLLGVGLYNALAVPPGTYPDLGWDGISTLLYGANWHFLVAGSNYFAQTGPTSPLAHTWSLAVEEQFYLIWPLIVLGILKLWRSTWGFLIVCSAGALASAAEMAVLFSPGAIDRLYYGTDSHAQSLLVGATLAVALSMWAQRRRRAGAERSPDGPVHRRHDLATMALGFGGVIGSVVLWTKVSANDALTYRGGFMLAALATSAVLLSVTLSPHSLIARGLAWAPLRYVGRVSYGMYVWHFPLFIFLDRSRTGLTVYPLFVARVAMTLAVATLSYHLLENPVRRGTLLRHGRAWLASPVAVAAVVIALLSATSPVYEARNAPSPIVKVLTSTETPAPVRVLWVGDSTAFTLAISLSAEQASYGVTSVDGAILGCGVTNGAAFQIKSVDAPMAPACSDGPSGVQWPQRWLNDIALYKPNVVLILTGRWEVANRTFDGRWTNIEDPAYAAYVKNRLEYATRIATSAGAHAILMTAPCYDTGEQPDGDPWPEDSPARLALYNEIVRQVAATSPHTTLLDLDSLACPGGHYEESVNHVVVRDADGVHFAPGGGIALASRIWPVVAAVGRPRPPAPYGYRSKTLPASGPAAGTAGAASSPHVRRRPMDITSASSAR